MITPDLLKTTSLFASLAQEDLERLAQAAADVVLEADEWLVREGERLNFFVVLEGELQLSKEIMGRNLVLTQFGLGDFFGEVSALFGVPSLSSLRASSRCRVAQFAVQYLQELVQGPTVCGATILNTLKERPAESGKHALELPSARVLVIGSQMETDLPEIRTFLRLNRIQYEWIDRERQPNRIPACVPSTHQGPSVVVDGCRWVSHPTTVRKLAEALEICTRPKKNTYDVVIIGGGPAGLSASVYGASEGLSVLLIERHAVGGQAGTSSRIENYLGFSNGISGDDLSERALKQARRFGAEMVLTREVTAVVALANGGYQIQLDGDEHISTKTVVLTTGVEWRFLEAEGVNRLLGKGVFYGSAGAEPSNVFGKDVFIVGGGNSAGQAAVFSANYARSVTLVRGDHLGESMSQYLVKQIAGKTNIFVETSTQILSVSGETRLKLIRTVRHGEEPLAREADVLYVMIGAKASTTWLPRELERNEQGFICTGRDVSKLTNWPASRLPFHLETSLAGCFCAGDVRHGSIKRVSSSVGEGSMTISFIHQFLALQGDAELP